MLDLRLIRPEIVVVIVIAGLLVAVVIVEVVVELSNIFQPYGSLSARAKFDAVFFGHLAQFFLRNRHSQEKTDPRNVHPAKSIHCCEMYSCQY